MAALTSREFLLFAEPYYSIRTMAIQRTDLHITGWCTANTDSIV